MSDDQVAHMPSPQLGAPFTVLQADSRFCHHESASQTLGGGARLNYWWESARANALWAARHGHQHLLYCLAEPCQHEIAGRLFTAWCKLRALSDAVASRDGAESANSLLLYLDSDAFWHPSTMRVETVLRKFVPTSDWAARGADSVSMFFGCNLPWKSEDRGRRVWNASLINADRGPPNDGVMLLRATASTRALLRAWWAMAAKSPRWNHKFAWEQSALWELWMTQPVFARRFRVLHDEERGECMRTMDPRRPTPIVHVTGGGLPPERRERRVDALGLRRNASRVWSTCLTRLDSRGGAGPCPAQRLEVTVGGAVVLGACGCPSESASP